MSRASDPSLVALHRPEREFAARWGLYSTAKDQWIDVYFVTKAEAELAIGILNRTGKEQGGTINGRSGTR